MIYLDCAASAPLTEESKTAWLEAASKYGNPSSLHPPGREAARALRQARIVIADALEVEPEGIIFTSSGSEANNLVINGLKNHSAEIYSSVLEHASVYFKLEAQFAPRITMLDVQSGGSCLLKKFPAHSFLPLMRVNNETGIVQPLPKQNDIIHFCDYTQALGKIAVRPKADAVKLASFSAHKIGAPRGAAFVWRSPEIVLEPFILGGGQEWQLRAGTENLAAICAMAQAISCAVKNIDETKKKLQTKMDLALSAISKIEDVFINGDTEQSSRAILNFSVTGLDADVLQYRLGEAGLCVSAGSACSSGASRPSRVLTAMGLEKERIRSALRVSWNDLTDEQELTDGFAILKETITRMRQEKKND